MKAIVTTVGQDQVGDHPNRFLDLFDFHGALLKLVHGLVEPFVADVNLHAKLGAQVL